MSMRACKQVATISSRATKINKTVNQETIVGRRRKRAISPTTSTLIELRECSQVIQPNFPTNGEKSNFSSLCETREASLVEAYASIQNVDMNLASQSDVLAKSSIDDESSMHVNDKHTDPCNMKVEVVPKIGLLIPECDKSSYANNFLRNGLVNQLI